MSAKSLSLFVAAIVVSGAIFPTLQAQTSKTVWDGVYTEEQEKRGVEVYEKECLSCHGGQLEGTEMAPGLADMTFKANWNGLTLGDLFDRMRETMPPDDPGRLGRQELADVLAHMLYANGMPTGEEELSRRPELLRIIRFEAYEPQE